MPTQADVPMSMEMFGQAYGYILYRTNVAEPFEGELRMDGMHDYAKVFVNGKEQGTLDRRLGQTSIAIHDEGTEGRLDILVENGGRINFSKHLRDQRKGIVGKVTLADKELLGWKIYPLPMSNVRGIKFAAKATTSGPAFLRGTFSVAQTGDTYLQINGGGKGLAWVNGHLLGRFWDIGPQQHCMCLPPGSRWGPTN